MKQWQIDEQAVRWQRNVRRYSLWLWLFFAPALGVVLYLSFTSGYHPARHVPPRPFSCASQRAEDKVLGDGGAISPLCGETP